MAQHAILAHDPTTDEEIDRKIRGPEAFSWASPEAALLRAGEE
jgi:hypothetical protein